LNGSNEDPFRSPTGPSSGSHGDSSGKRKGITAFLTGANPTTTPHSDTNGIDNGVLDEPEDGEDGFDYENANYGFVRRTNMAQDIMVTFLGTSSGGGPTKSRNCSSLVVDMVGDGTLWSAYCPF
jgi:hypothetical protein